MKERCICDKCGKEGLCDVEEFVCVSENTDDQIEGKKTRRISVYKYLTNVTCRLCANCVKKRKIRFLSFAFLSLIASLPFFIWWMYLEFGFIFLIFSVTVILLSTKSHEMEYVARLHYKKYREEKDEFVLHPKLVTEAKWAEMIKDPDKKNTRIVL